MKDVQYGVVSNEIMVCRIYSKPSILSNLVGYIYPGDLVVIDEKESTDCYLKVHCVDGTPGFCLRPQVRFIEKEKIE